MVRMCGVPFAPLAMQNSAYGRMRLQAAARWYRLGIVVVAARLLSRGHRWSEASAVVHRFVSGCAQHWRKCLWVRVSYTLRYISITSPSSLYACLPSGKRPVRALPRCRPRYHPSPKSSSFSISSMRSPFARLNSSSLRATKSWMTTRRAPGCTSCLATGLAAMFRYPNAPVERV